MSTTYCNVNTNIKNNKTTDNIGYMYRYVGTGHRPAPAGEFTIKLHGT